MRQLKRDDLISDLSRSQVMIVRVLNESGALIETHESQGAFREVAVFGIPDPKWGEIVKACVVLKPGKHLLRKS